MSQLKHSSITALVFGIGIGVSVCSLGASLFPIIAAGLPPPAAGPRSVLATPIVCASTAPVATEAPASPPPTVAVRGGADACLDVNPSGEARLTPPGSGKSVVSFSLYGNNLRYVAMAVVNAAMFRTVWGRWTMRVYHDNSVSADVLQLLRAKGAELVDVTGSRVNKMSWRFLPADDPTVERFCVRDIDAQLLERDRAAVDEWVASGLPFEVSRDHPNHHRYSVSGGLWCAHRPSAFAGFNMNRALQRVTNQAYMVDMNFLHSVLWPRMRKLGVMQHTDAPTPRWGETRRFPTPMERCGAHLGDALLWYRKSK